MENRFEHTPPEEQQGWGKYATPPPLPGQLNSQRSQNPPQVSLCVKVQEMLPHLLEHDGEIRPEMASHIYGHLTTCANCAQEFDAMHRVVSLLETLPPVEMPMDFSGIIMQQIYAEAPVSHKLAAPSRLADAVTTSVETTQAVAQQTEQTTVSVEQQAVTHIGIQLWERLTITGIFAAMISFLLSTKWGQNMLGSNLEVASSWTEQVCNELRRIPILTWVVTGVFSVLSQAGNLLQQTYRNLGPIAARGLMIDVALVAAAYYYLVVRRQRGQRLSV